MSFKSPKMDTIQEYFKNSFDYASFHLPRPLQNKIEATLSRVSATGLKEIEGHNVDVWSPIFSCLQRVYGCEENSVECLPQQ